jgi:hypothetical protein
MTLLRLTGLTALALLAGLWWYLADLQPGALALQFAFTPRTFGEVVHAWSIEQLARYRLHLLADGVLLLAYGTFGFLLATRTALFTGLPAWLRRLAPWWLPLAAAFDAVENALHGWLTAVPRFGVPLPYALAACASVLKWALLIGFALLAAWALARAED